MVTKTSQKTWALSSPVRDGPVGNWIAFSTRLTIIGPLKSNCTPSEHISNSFNAMFHLINHFLTHSELFFRACLRLAWANTPDCTNRLKNDNLKYCRLIFIPIYWGDYGHKLQIMSYI